MRSAGSRTSGRGAWRAIVAGALAVGILAGSPRAARADTYKDEKRGFSLSSPKKWKSLPIAPDEKFVVASWGSEREWEQMDPKTNMGVRHRPQLDVVILPKTETEKKTGTVIEKKGDVVNVSMTRKEYKDFKDYLDQSSKNYGSGYFFSKEEETKVGGLTVKFYEVTLEKLATAPMKRWGWAFYAEDGIYGITGDSLSKFEEKVYPDLEAAYRSFKVFAHSAALGGAATTGPDTEVVVGGKKDTADDKRRKREDDFNVYLAKAKETLADGWKTKETDHFVVFTHTDDKTTKELVDHAEALRGWLDENLGLLGPETPGKTILRICADSAEYNALGRTAGRSMNGFKFEIYTYKDREFAADTRLWELNQGLYRVWMTSKNYELNGRLPVWIDVGLTACVRTAMSKGRKVEFKPAQMENEVMSTMGRSKEPKIVNAKDFLTKDTESLVKAENLLFQAEFFARYLLVGGAQRNPKYKALLTSYLTNYVAMVDEEAKAEKKPVSSAAPKDEAEEDALFKERANKWKEREREILQKLLDKTFVGWEDKDWDSFNRAYLKELGV